MTQQTLTLMALVQNQQGKIDKLMEQSQGLMEDVAKGQYKGNQQETPKDDKQQKRKKQRVVYKLLCMGVSQ